MGISFYLASRPPAHVRALFHALAADDGSHFFPVPWSNLPSHLLHLLHYHIMGDQSQKRKSSFKAAKEKKLRTNHAFGNAPSSGRQQNFTQLTVDGNVCQSIATGTKPCNYCIAIQNGQERSYKKGHDPTCPKSMKFNKSERTIQIEKEEDWLKKLNSTLPDQQVQRGSIKSFFTAKPTSQVAQIDSTPSERIKVAPLAVEPTEFSPTPTELMEVAPTDTANVESPPPATLPTFDTSLDRETIKKEVGIRAKKIDSGKNGNSRSPIAVQALTDYLLDLCPSKFKSNSNEIISSARSSEMNNKLEWYKRHFPLGTISFTVPRDDITSEPDPLFQELEGVTIIIAR